MTRLRFWVCTVVLAVLWTASCWPFRKARPAAPASAPTPVSAQPPAPEPPLPEARPTTAESEPPEVPAEQPVLRPPVVMIPAPLPAPPKRPSPAGPRVEQPSGEPQPQAPPAAPPPQLKQILTPEQRAALERNINDRLTRARATLASLRGKTLNPQQTALVEHIRTFIAQAEEARSTDLLRASNLAERADVLARDLAVSVR
jgi:hypothetical protein